MKYNSREELQIGKICQIADIALAFFIKKTLGGGFLAQVYQN